MGKKKPKKEYHIDNTALADNELILYGSTNGWLRMVFNSGASTFFIPDKHAAVDEPSAWYLIGKYCMEEDNANG